ncbi:lipopolysaccharide biosynthesis protein [Limnobacter sp.]|uniref:lipopolysaccharide biosynthesis protein n=1 Tax=Limnobacter sp. TaxID=2003368 RepID=UPI002FDFE770
MFKSLIKNTLISGVAFFAVSVLGLLLVPYLVSAYGVAGFGVISMARLFIPLMGMGIFDLGFGEIATHSVARARAEGQWAHALAVLLQIGLLALGIGAVLGGVLYLLAPSLGNWMSITGVLYTEFQLALELTALLLPLLFASLVFEGIIKGFENFKLQRLIEVAAALAYTVGAVYIIWKGFGLYWVCAVFLFAQSGRAVLALVFAVRLLDPHRVSFSGFDRIARAEIRARSPGLSASKILGTTQSNGPVLLISFLLGPSSVGVYEALSRIPRFAKSVVGLVNGIVQPLAARLDHGAQGATDMAKLIGNGTLLLACVVLPLYASAMAFSEPMLRLWLSNEFSGLWYWQSALFVFPALAGLVGFGASALIGRVQSVSRFNRIAVLFIVVQLLIGFLLQSWLSEFAFIVGQVVAACIAFVLQFRVIQQAIALPSGTYRKLSVVVVSVLAFSLPCYYFASQVGNLLQLALAGALSVTAMIVISFGLAFRHNLIQKFKS